MKVIFLKDAPKIGKKYEVKNIADGHALNFLIPRGFVKVATPDALKKVEVLRKEMDTDRKIQEDLLAKNLHEIDGKEVKISAKASDKGHLFASLHTQQIAEAIKKSIGADILPDFIILEKHIKETGTHDIEVKAGDKTAKIRLLVEAE